jgi:hypothetical protein
VPEPPPEPLPPEPAPEPDPEPESDEPPEPPEEPDEPPPGPEASPLPDDPLSLESTTGLSTVGGAASSLTTGAALPPALGAEATGVVALTAESAGPRVMNEGDRPDTGLVTTEPGPKAPVEPSEALLSITIACMSGDSRRAAAWAVSGGWTKGSSGARTRCARFGNGTARPPKVRRGTGTKVSRARRRAWYRDRSTASVTRPPDCRSWGRAAFMD